MSGASGKRRVDDVAGGVDDVEQLLPRQSELTQCNAIIGRLGVRHVEVGLSADRVSDDDSEGVSEGDADAGVCSDDIAAEPASTERSMRGPSNRAIRRLDTGMERGSRGSDSGD